MGLYTKLLQKMCNNMMVKYNGDHYPAQGAKKMSIVVNSIMRLFGGVGAINQV